MRTSRAGPGRATGRGRLGLRQCPTPPARASNAAPARAAAGRNGILERDSDGDDVNYDDITLVDTLEPLQATQRLKEDVQELVTAGVLTKKQAAPLIVKLDAATSLIVKGKDRAAITKLQDFIKQVQTYVKTGKLPPGTSQDLIDQAKVIITSLQP